MSVHIRTTQASWSAGTRGCSRAAEVVHTRPAVPPVAQARRCWTGQSPPSSQRMEQLCCVASLNLLFPFRSRNVYPARSPGALPLWPAPAVFLRNSSGNCPPAPLHSFICMAALGAIVSSNETPWLQITAAWAATFPEIGK